MISILLHGFCLNGNDKWGIRFRLERSFAGFLCLNGPYPFSASLTAQAASALANYDAATAVTCGNCCDQLLTSLAELFDLVERFAYVWPHHIIS